MPDKYSSVHSGSNVDKGVQLAIEIAEGSRVAPKAQRDASGNIFTVKYGTSLSITSTPVTGGGTTYQLRLLNASDTGIGSDVSLTNVPSQTQITALDTRITNLSDAIAGEISDLEGELVPVVTSTSAPNAITLKSIYDEYGVRPIVLIPSDGSPYFISFRSRSSGGSTWVKFTILLLGTENRYSCQNEIITSSGSWTSLTLATAISTPDYEASYCRGRAIADLYSTSTSYAVRDRVMYNGLMYRCLTPTTGTFDPSK